MRGCRGMGAIMASKEPKSKAIAMKKGNWIQDAIKKPGGLKSDYD